MKYLPIGIQTLPKIIENNYIYVDKTRMIHQLVTTGSFYFFSRPRRFGKSLLVSTLKELYSGNKSVFEGLWIENHWDWTKKNPVIHFSFDDMTYHQVGINQAITDEINRISNSFDIEIDTRFEPHNHKGNLKNLIEKVSEKHGKVVFLVDEYDKPILDFLETNTLDIAKANRDVLREFYGVLKNADSHLEFVFITGISKFSKVSLFSHLNNLDDITLDENYSTLVGYTQEELELYFDDYLKEIEIKLQTTREKLLGTMREWYNGFSWDGINSVYNPFGTLNFLSKKVFRNFWFSTGSPRFLVDKMKKETYFNIENIVVTNVALESYDLDNIGLISLLFQTGYLTIKELDPYTGEMVLDYPNKEVRESMYQFLIGDIAHNPQRTNTGMTIKDLNQAFASRDLERVKDIINSLLADLPSETFIKQIEGLYHGLIHLVFSYLGVMAQSEVHSSRGRADAVVQTDTDVYIFEFKFNKTAQEAIDQIHKNKYAAKYLASGKTITGIGVNFNNELKEIDDWVEVVL
jgi:Predicted AAA-ATPase/PD-(D/E)XK nuclease superfamily